MSRSELVHKLAQAGARGDREALQHTMNLLITEARSQQQHSHANRLSAVLNEGRDKTPSVRKQEMKIPDSVRELVADAPPRRSLNDLVLAPTVRDALLEFIEEYSHSDLLRANSLEPRHTILLVGPPGNGKTSIAEAIAFELGLPFFTARYDAIVDSYLGETASRLRRLVEFAATTPCVLFFDEFDAVGKERGDTQETGEIKRVVSSLLVQMDALPSHCVVVCATNHPELLDRAVWRRFEVKLEIGLPSEKDLSEWFSRLEQSLGGNLRIPAHEFVELMLGQSFSDIEAFTLDIRRKLVLSKEGAQPSDVVRAALDRWSSQSRIGGGLSADHGGLSTHTDFNESNEAQKEFPGESRIFHASSPLEYKLNANNPHSTELRRLLDGSTKALKSRAIRPAQPRTVP